MENDNFYAHRNIDVKKVAGNITKAFNADFLDEETCRRFLLSSLHPEGALCPRCRLPLTEKRTIAFWTGRRVKCGKCRKEFTALTGKFLAHCHWSLTQFFLLAFLIGLTLKDYRIASIMDCHIETVKKWKGTLF